MCGIATSSCSQTGSAGKLSAPDVFVGSTPCDSLSKALLKLPLDTKCEFIRWDLSLSKGSDSAFALTIIYGEGQPNTTDFKGGGEKRTLKGIYKTTQRGTLNGAMLQLVADNASDHISFIKLDDNLYHLLSPDGQLMVGNGGWSYTLSRKERQAPGPSLLPALISSSSLLSDTARRVVFEGRTPCQDLAKAYNLGVDDDCFKLKWQLVLYRDPVTSLPSRYSLNWTLSRSLPIEGKWTVTRGQGGNRDAVIYQLHPNQSNPSFSFLAGDRNVLFLLDKAGRLLPGDSNFSYTLNRRQ
ncbi:MAG TPA: hypothetical protein VGE66_20515 [Chitinophagaceae bacterium]